MAITLTMPPQAMNDFQPRITVVGVGGGGSNAVNNMIASQLEGVEFIVANTDAQSLMHSRADRRIQLGPHLTQGLGAGGRPDIGRGAAEEAMEEIASHLAGSHMVFITAGMGGGTGTGAAPVVARIARERGILTVGVVTKPFEFEGQKRRRSAEQGIEELQSVVDTLIVIPNQNLFRLANDRTTFAEAFKMADNVLYMGVRGVTDLIVNPGVVNLDFADIRSVMAEMGKAMMGTGEADGDDRATRAAESAISNPLLEEASMKGAKAVLINITGGMDMTLFEVDEAANRIRKEVGEEEANIIFGSSINEDMDGRIRVSVVATGMEANAAAKPRPTLVAVTGAASPRPMPAPAPAAMGGASPITAGIAGAAMVAPAMPARAAAQPTMSAPQPSYQTAGATALAAQIEPMGEAVAQAMTQPAAAPEPVVAAEPDHTQAASLFAPRTAETAAAPGTAPAERRPSIFRRVTQQLMQRELDAPSHARQAPTLQAPAMGAEPVTPQPQPAPAMPEPTARQMPRTAAADELGLEIPAFLRRQAN
ncbi:cell division protein FtsZ [Elioraea sp.]|uniref:cell division protein FtsZ n=1 Tax=Elioraea sp. TaxID=2185103 RepID=UPI0025BB20B5|nr:cell division protein FtsZ [Elioraea sp.]